LKKDALKYFGLEKSTINKKIRITGKTFEEVCEFYIEKKNPEGKYCFNGKRFKSIDDMCDFLHVQRCTFYQYMKKHNMTIEETYNWYYQKYILENEL
jgi:hypothetical protein